MTRPTHTRRELLAAGGTTALAAIAGCSAVSTTRLTPVEEEQDGETIHLHYGHDDEAVATISLVAEWVHRPSDYVPFHTLLWMADGLAVERLRYEFRLPAGAAGSPKLYLARSQGPPWDTAQFRSDDNRVTTLEFQDLDSWSGSVQGRLLAAEHHHGDELTMDAEATLDRGRLSGDYELTGTATTQLPAEEG